MINCKCCFITGTPGTGKTTLSEELSKLTELRHIAVGKFAQENGFFESYDAERDSHVMDEDRVLDEMEPIMSDGNGCIVDHHDCELFPERWFDVVFVLRTDNTKLYERLEERGYAASKVQENVQCEIFQTILDEARESYKEEIVHELPSNTPEQLESNLTQIVSWVETWRAQHPPTTLHK